MNSRPPIPAAFDTTATKSKGSSEQDIPQTPAYEMLQEYADAHPINPYVAVIGVWDTDQHHYNYRSMPLEFPDSVSNDTDTNHLAYYLYRLESPNRPVRNLAALIPPGADARDLMFRWLRLKTVVSIIVCLGYRSVEESSYRS